MERYTYFEGGKWRIGVSDTEYSGSWVDRLAAYEDTGLEPEEVAELRSAAELERKVGSAVGDGLDRIIRSAEAVLAHTEDSEALQAYRALGTVEELATLVKAQDEGPVAGDSVYVLERDEYGEAVDVSGFMLLAVVGQGAILSPYIDEITDLEGTIEDHIRETEENMSTNLYVYPIEDVYLTPAEAEAALGGGGDG